MRRRARLRGHARAGLAPPDLAHGQGAPRLRQGAAFRARFARRPLPGRRLAEPSAPIRSGNIEIRHAREHNLKGIDVSIPRGKFTVVTGVSGSGKVHARLRHSLRRGAAPLPGVAQCVRAPVRAARLEARRRRDLRHPAHRGDRAANEPRRIEEHRGHANRDPPFPAPALRETRHAALPGLRRADRAAERGRDRRAPAPGTPRRAPRASLAAGREPQGLLHRPRQVGRVERRVAPSRRRRIPAHRALAEA